MRPALPTLLLLALTGCLPGGVAVGKDDGDSGGDSGADSGGDSGDDTPIGDAVDGLQAQLHDSILSLVYVSWTQLETVDTVRVEYSFDDGEWLTTPATPGNPGAHAELLLGIPYGEDVQWRVVSERGSQAATEDGPGITTGAAPSRLPVPTLDIADPTAWDDAGRYLLTSISEEDAFNNSEPHFWVVLVDRQGRYVWAVPADPASWTLFVKPSRDGKAILYDDSLFWTQFDGGIDGVVHRIHIDGSEERVWSTPALHHSFDDLSDDTLLWSAASRGNDELYVTDNNGVPEKVWDCLDWVLASDIVRNPDRPSQEACGSNALAYDEDRDSYVMSLWTHETVLEIDARSGEVVWYADPNRGHGYAVDASAVWHWQHEAHLLPDGHLLLSSGIDADPPNRDGSYVATAAYEYVLDHDAHTADLVWSYTSEPEWASRFKGGAQRLPGGNTLHYYGDVGGAKEITPGGDVVWQIRFESGRGSWIGRSNFVDDLYAFDR